MVISDIGYPNYLVLHCGEIISTVKKTGGKGNVAFHFPPKMSVGPVVDSRLA
jgi:hypothetical protein